MKIIITLGISSKDVKLNSHLLDRLNETIKQYEVGDTVIVSGARKYFDISEAQIMSEYLKNNNIKTIKEECSLNTIDNAIYTFEIVKNLKLKENTKIMVITSDFHTPRTSLIFLHYFLGLSLCFQMAKTSKVDSFFYSEKNKIANLLKLNTLPNYSEPSIFQYVKAGYLDGVKSRINHFNNRDELGNSPLHCAANLGFTNICKYLVKNGLSVNITNYNGLSPIFYSLINGFVDTTWFFLNNKPDLGIKGYCNKYWNGKCNLLEALSVLREKFTQDIYTTLLLMINKFSTENQVVWIRHAESVLNKAKREKKDTSGIFDAKLTDDGINMLLKINAMICKYDLLDEYDVIVSPLKRTLETCRYLIEGKDIKPIVDSRICERLNHTSCIGTNCTILKNQYNWNFLSMPDEWWFDPKNNNTLNDSVNEENWGKLRSRVKPFYDEIHKFKKRKTLVVTHGGVITLLFNGRVKPRNCDSFII